MSRTFKPKRIYINDDHAFENHGAAILLLVREEIVNDWKSLCHAFNFDARSFHSGHFALKRTIERLVEADLLTSKNDQLGPYELTDRAFQTIGAFGFSLTQAATLPYPEGVATRPIFGKPSRLAKAPHVFVLMPFATDLRRVYDGPIKAACRSLRLSVDL